MLLFFQYHQSAIYMASENGHNETVQLLLLRGADLIRLIVVRFTCSDTYIEQLLL